METNKFQHIATTGIKQRKPLNLHTFKIRLQFEFISNLFHTLERMNTGLDVDKYFRGMEKMKRRRDNYFSPEWWGLLLQYDAEHSADGALPRAPESTSATLAHSGQMSSSLDTWGGKCTLQWRPLHSPLESFYGRGRSQPLGKGGREERVLLGPTGQYASSHIIQPLLGLLPHIPACAGSVSVHFN